ncbi:MAG: hypothetical protein A3I66_01480 [Burkholderiales bacterium RIFCSPLOWO2_02_FULL_57_36]|nr:MAG: hypothetical protein A3I66_01480 [Burkholderiales bacterium RIFCSPLOWO2_02_FULL_57_36]
MLDAVLSGWAACWAFLYSLYAYARLQTRILTATDGWLDVIAGDFFGTAIVRKQHQTDASFRATIIINLFRERATRASVIAILTELTGRVPVVIEPQRPADTGAYSVPNTGYGVNGAYGSMLLPAQAFVTAFRPVGSGIPYVAGYGISTGGYGVASRAEYGSLSMIEDTVTDADIYAAIDSVKVAGTAVWARITT